jgi:hypothetical protein
MSFFKVSYLHSKRRDSSVGIATRLGAGRLEFQGSIPAGAGNFSLHHRVQNGSGAHPGSFPGGKAGGV